MTFEINVIHHASDDLLLGITQNSRTISDLGIRTRGEEKESIYDGIWFLIEGIHRGISTFFPRLKTAEMVLEINRKCHWNLVRACSLVNLESSRSLDICKKYVDGFNVDEMKQTPRPCFLIAVALGHILIAQNRTVQSKPQCNSLELQNCICYCRSMVRAFTRVCSYNVRTYKDALWILKPRLYVCWNRGGTKNFYNLNSVWAKITKKEEWISCSSRVKQGFLISFIIIFFLFSLHGIMPRAQAWINIMTTFVYGSTIRDKGIPWKSVVSLYEEMI